MLTHASLSNAFRRVWSFIYNRYSVDDIGDIHRKNLIFFNFRSAKFPET